VLSLQSARAQKNWARARELVRRHQSHGFERGKEESHGALSCTHATGAASYASPLALSVSRNIVRAFFDTVDESILRSEQLRDREAVKMDERLLPDLVMVENSRVCGLNAHLLMNADEFGGRVRELIEKGERSFRIIVRLGEEGSHFAAFDVDNEGWLLSVVGVEPATFASPVARELAQRCQDSLAGQLPDASFVVLESDLQRSGGECGMFSLSLVKKMHKERAVLKVLHDENIFGRFRLPQDQTPCNLLPPSLMKHAQSQDRLQRYLAANPGAAGVTVNKRGETLEARQRQYIGDWRVRGKGTRAYSRSIEIKRRTEYGELLKQFDGP